MDYEVLVKKIETLLIKTKYAVLATANKEGIVSASKMCMISNGLKVYFQTDASFEKVQNIRENPNVAINVGSIYFKGTAHIIGHPATNKMFINKMKQEHFETYENYTNLPNQILIEVELTECRIWGIYNSLSNCESKIEESSREEIIKVLDLKKKTLRNITCDKLKDGF